MSDTADPQCPCEMTGLLLGLGNPLLDISANVSEDVLKKYGLKPDDAIMADEKHMPIYQELIDKHNAEFIAGGSVQNTLRVAQWVLKRPNVCTYFGCVGNDSYAEILREKAVADGVNVMYQVSEEVPTGTCAVLVTNTHRSLCANLAAAQKFTPDHLEDPKCKKYIDSAKFFYVSGYFLAVSPESLMTLAKHAHSRGHVFSMNVSAPFVVQFYKEPLNNLLPYVDILFGNTVEIEAFAKAYDIQEKSIEDIGLKIASLPMQDEKKQRVVVITQSHNPVILVKGDKVEHVPVIPLPHEKIVDTNGAGDAFTGGFLSQLVLGKPYKTCVECGIYTAAHIIQHSGCIFSGECEFKESKTVYCQC